MSQTCNGWKRRSCDTMGSCQKSFYRYRSISGSSGRKRKLYLKSCRSRSRYGRTGYPNFRSRPNSRARRGDAHFRGSEYYSKHPLQKSNSRTSSYRNSSRDFLMSRKPYPDHSKTRHNVRDKMKSRDRYDYSNSRYKKRPTHRKYFNSLKRSSTPDHYKKGYHERSYKKRHAQSEKSSKKASKKQKDGDIQHFEWVSGQILGNRYEIKDQTGEGTFGRVLMCKDIKTGAYVAIKVVRAVERYTAAAKIEASILKDIQRLDPNKDSRCVDMVDSFMHEDKHMCLVFELLGLSLYEYLAQNDYNGFFLNDIKSFARQTLQALAFMHKAGLTHTDLKPENILLEDFPPNDITLSIAKRSPVTIKRPISTRIKIIDFGSATFANEYHCSIINTRQYRGPEIILDLGWDMSSDLWSLGCILLELYTGSLLFKTHEHLEHLAMMEKIIGPFPLKMMEAAHKTEGRKYLHPIEKRLDWPEGASSYNSIQRVKDCVPLECLISRKDSHFAEFLLFLLQIDPASRPHPETALKHKFLQK